MLRTGSMFRLTIAYRMLSREELRISRTTMKHIMYFFDAPGASQSVPSPPRLGRRSHNLHVLTNVGDAGNDEAPRIVWIRFGVRMVKYRRNDVRRTTGRR